MSHTTRYDRTISYVDTETWGMIKGIVLVLLVNRIRAAQAEKKLHKRIVKQPYIFYGELSEEIKKLIGVEVDPHFDMGHVVGELSEDEFKRGNGMISALVVTKDEDTEEITPGKGFFDLAKTLGQKVKIGRAHV